MVVWPPSDVLGNQAIKVNRYGEEQLLDHTSSEASLGTPSSSQW
jgi:hypothetical protein